MQLGYCCNVHPGTTTEEVKRNLTEYSLAVKDIVRPRETMGIGLWLSETASRELAAEDNSKRFGDWLNDVGLLPFTFNGFPFGNFHQPIVKHSVYEPTWADPARLDYSIRLAEIQDQLLPPHIDASISTLPLGWPTSSKLVRDESFFRQCAKNLQACADRLHEMEQKSGRKTMVCIEPEPGCCLDTCDDVTGFFDEHLKTGSSEQNDRILRHIGVCHDICHSAVMFEDQATAIRAYKDAGIAVGKIQVSSAVKVCFDSFSIDERRQPLAQLKTFAEPRYLHQTTIKRDDKSEFYEDLPTALDSAGGEPTGEWRVHFHVPIFLSNFGQIETTKSQIMECLDALAAHDSQVEHFEIETYAWNVLPQTVQLDSLAQGIADEFEWFETLVNGRSQDSQR